MPELVFYLLIFFVVGVFFLFFHLVMGKLIRPDRMDDEKKTIYECGEPTIGSAWIQFDLRYYVVALLFVIFDVEVAFFFPWAVVFGSANTLANPDLDKDKRQEISQQLIPAFEYQAEEATAKEAEAQLKFAEELHKRGSISKEELHVFHSDLINLQAALNAKKIITEDSAKVMAWLTFLDIVIFFGVLLVGFAYLWKRGDIDWVRSTAAEKTAAPPAEPL